jgi:hypothetical protein
MRRLQRRDPELTRQRLVHPYEGSYKDRLMEAHAVDLRDNAHVVPLPGGYSKITPVHSEARVRRDT